MKTAGEIRRENLELLVRELGTLDSLAAKAGSTPIYLSQVRNRARDRKTGRTRELGNAMARRLEAATGKPAGWMDREHGETSAGNPAADALVLTEAERALVVGYRKGAASIDQRIESMVADYREALVAIGAGALQGRLHARALNILTTGDELHGEQTAPTAAPSPVAGKRAAKGRTTRT